MTTTQPSRTDLSIAVLSGPTVLIQYAGLRLLTDPTFDEPGHYEMAGLPVEKTGASPLSAADSGPIDAVLLSHDQHADNLDNAGRALLDRVPLTLTTAAGAQRLGGTAAGLRFWDERVLVGPTGTDVRVIAVPARHGPVGSEPYTGDVIGFVLTAAGMPRVYISGDNASLEAVEQIAERTGPIDTAVLFIGGVHHEAFFDGALLTLDNERAASAARILGARRVIPAHIEGWSHFEGDRSDLVDAFTRRGVAERLDWGYGATADAGSR